MIGGTDCLSQRDHVLAEKLSLCRTLEVYFKNNVVFKKDRKISKNTNSCLRNRLRVEWWVVRVNRWGGMSKRWGMKGEGCGGKSWRISECLRSTFQEGRWNEKGPSTVDPQTIKSENLWRHIVLKRWYLCHIVHWSHLLRKILWLIYTQGLYTVHRAK